MRKQITRDMAIDATARRIGFISLARSREELCLHAVAGRMDLQQMLAMGLIGPEEKILMECDLSKAVQDRNTQLIPPHLRLVWSRP